MPLIVNDEKASKRNEKSRLVELQLKKRPSFVSWMPNSLIIEPGTICQLKCHFCPQSYDDFDLKKEFLKFNDFKKIIDYFEDFVTDINLFNWGEPLLNAYLPEMIIYASEKKICTVVHSNLIFLTENLAEKLIKSGLSVLVASIDGASEESYQVYRKGGSFTVAFENLKLLLNKKKKLKMKTPDIIWKFLIFKHNEHEIEKAKYIAQEIEAHIDFKFACTQGEFEPTLEQYNSKDFVSKFVKNYGFPCDQLWRSPVILSNGDVLPCCMVSQKKYVVGNMFKQNFKNIWNNEKYQSLRRIVAGKAIADDSSFCYYCAFKSKSYI